MVSREEIVFSMAKLMGRHMIVFSMAKFDFARREIQDK